jgi:uncharacterized glyoxalase superfamily protein PhnB
MPSLPTEHPTLLPYLVVADAHAAIDFYVRAFGAKEAFRLDDKDGRIGHAELDLGTGRIMLASPYPEMGAFPPVPDQPSPIALTLYVLDVDQVTERAVELGATLIAPPEDQFYGDRVARLKDPAGHFWNLHQLNTTLTPEEMQRLFDAM